MYCINRLCFVCLNENNLSKINGNLIKNVIYKKLTYCFPEINISKIGSCLYICSSCQSLLRNLYKFKRMYVKNFIRWNNYVNILSNDNNNDKKDLRIFVYSPSKNLPKRKQFNFCVRNEEGITGKELSEYENNVIDNTVADSPLQINNCDNEVVELLFDDLELPNNTQKHKNNENGYTSKQNDKLNENNFHSDFIVITNVESINEDDEDLQKELCTEKEEVKQLDTNNTFKLQKEQSKEERVKANKKGDTLGWHRNKTLDLKKSTVCNLCGTICDDDKQLQSHQYRKHPILRQCTICNRFIRSEYMEHHVTLHKSINYECHICNLKFDTNKDFVIHKREHGIKEFNCAMCNRDFPRKLALERHIKCHLGIRLGIKDYECTICEKKFVEKNTLAVHIRHHMGLRNKKCGICGEAFPNKKYLNIHMKSHINVNVGEYECDVCHKRFRHKGNYKVHVKIHNKGIIKEYQCHLCPKTYGYKSSLNLHVLTHSKLIK